MLMYEPFCFSSIVLTQALGYSRNMRLLISLLAIPLICGVQVTDTLADVYKHTNPDGSVEFTDVPQSKEEAPVELAPMSTFKALPVAPVPTPNLQPAPSQHNYTSLKITSPENDTSIRGNTGNLDINVSLSPALNAGHKLVLLMNGSQKAEGESGQFNLTNIDRGSHTFQVEVVDAENKSLISSQAITIHLKRFSALRNRAK